MASSDDPIDAAWLQEATGLGQVEVLAEASSTMDRGRVIAADATAPLPAAVIAERQTAGRGRRGASWWQSPGSLAVSLVIDGTPWSDGARPIWSLACGVAVAEAVRDVEPTVEAMVRWPNDVEVAGRKLAGILVESVAGGRAIFGIGVNTTGSVSEAPLPLRPRVATMPDLTGRPLSRQRLLANVVPRLLDLLSASPGEVARRYRPLCSLTGMPIRVFVGVAVHEGVCQGIVDDGGLIVANPTGTVVLHSGSLTPPGHEWHGDS